MKKLLLIISIALFGFSKAQLGDSKSWTPVAILMCTRVEGTIIHDNAYFTLGTKIPFNEKNYISLRGHFNWWDAENRKFTVIPELDYIRNVKKFSDDAGLSNIYVSGGISPNYVSPKVGINLYHIFGAEIGYNFNFRENKNLETKGLRGSVGINFIF